MMMMMMMEEEERRGGAGRLPAPEQRGAHYVSQQVKQTLEQQH